MHATLDGQSIVPDTVAIATFAYDRQEPGPHELVFDLDPEDLRAVGRHIDEYAKDAVADDPGYFESEWMGDVPKPRSPDLFASDPALLAIYHAEPFWSRETLLAILDRAGERPVRFSCYVSRFVDSTVVGGSVRARFEAYSADAK